MVCGSFFLLQPRAAYAASNIQISTGEYYSEALLVDGTLWAWGRNNYGQLGDGSTVDRATPIQISLINTVKAVSCGLNHTLALKADGTVWAWGYNNYGQLGNGETINRGAPVPVSGLTSVKQVISVSNAYSVALKEDGTVWAWGLNSNGQLGDGTTVSKSTPVQVKGLSSIKSISCSSTFCIALKSDGTVWSWGNNQYGQLGDGTTISRTVPVQVSGLTSVKKVVVGLYYCLALKEDGSVWSWGYNAHGELGDGYKVNRSAPVQISQLNSVNDITCGQYHTLALKQDGTVWSWGYNNVGQLGDGTNTSKSVPTQIPDLNNIKSIGCGRYNTSTTNGCDYSAVLKQDGTVWTWGYNGYGQLGNGTTTSSNKPVQVFDLTSVKNIFCQDVSTCAIKEDGTVWAWGYNANGELGNGLKTNSSRPVRVLVPTINSTEISLAADTDGTQIKLSWDAVGGVSNYTVKKSTTAGGPYTVLNDSVTNTSFTDSEVSNGITYYYIVTAINDKGENITSNEVSGILTGTTSSPELLVNSVDNLKLGEEFTANIVLNNAVNICAEDIKITYDATLFEYIGTEAIQGLKIYKEENQEIGTLRFIIASKGREYALNGQNALLKLKFKAKKLGKGIISVVKGRIADNGTVEMDVATENCGNKSITVLGTKDVNRSGEFTLLDLAIDAWYFGYNAADTDTSKFDADVITDGVIDDADLSAIVEQMLNNPGYVANK